MTTEEKELPSRIHAESNPFITNKPLSDKAYVDNDLLYEHLKEFHKEWDSSGKKPERDWFKLAENKRVDIPPGLPDFNNYSEIVNAIIIIPQRFIYKWNFNNYKFMHDDMVSHGQLKLMRKFWKFANFEIESKSNPFAYYTTIVNFAFIELIKQHNNKNEKYKEWIRNSIAEWSSHDNLVYKEVTDNLIKYFDEYDMSNKKKEK